MAHWLELLVLRTGLNEEEEETGGEKGAQSESKNERGLVQRSVESSRRERERKKRGCAREPDITSQLLPRTRESGSEFIDCH